jgi:hypothetical protein
LVVPGGGAFADTVREYDQRYRLSDHAAHWMAVLAMDQYGYLLCDRLPESLPVRSLADARRIWEAGRVPVLLPFTLLNQVDPLPHSWEVTSDSIAAWIAGAVGARLLILLKDVDGLHTADPRSASDAGLLHEAFPEQVAGCAGIDPFLPSLMAEGDLDAWVINGEKPDRLAELLATGRTRGTHVARSVA